jgi:ABC-type molybdate transport system substrate-binding protein
LFDIASRHAKSTNTVVATISVGAAPFGASGLLQKEIVDGANAHVFASANMEHPQALAQVNI